MEWAGGGGEVRTRFHGQTDIEVKLTVAPAAWKKAEYGHES